MRTKDMYNKLEEDCQEELPEKEEILYRRRNPENQKPEKPEEKKPEKPEEKKKLTLTEKVSFTLSSWEKATDSAMKITRCELTGLIILRSGNETCRIEDDRNLPVLAKRLQGIAKRCGIAGNDFLLGLRDYIEENKKVFNPMKMITTGNLEPTMSVRNMFSKVVTMGEEKQDMNSGADLLAQWMKGVVQSALHGFPNPICPVIVTPCVFNVEMFLKHLFKPFPFLLYNKFSSYDDFRLRLIPEENYLAIVLKEFRLTKENGLRVNCLVRSTGENRLASYIGVTLQEDYLSYKRAEYPPIYIEETNLMEWEKIEPVQIWRHIKKNLPQETLLQSVGTGSVEKMRRKESVANLEYDILSGIVDGYSSADELTLYFRDREKLIDFLVVYYHIGRDGIDSVLTPEFLNRHGRTSKVMYEGGKSEKGFTLQMHFPDCIWEKAKEYMRKQKDRSFPNPIYVTNIIMQELKEVLLQGLEGEERKRVHSLLPCFKLAVHTYLQELHIIPKK